MMNIILDNSKPLGLLIICIHHLLELARKVLAHILQYTCSQVHRDAVTVQQVLDPLPVKKKDQGWLGIMLRWFLKF